VVRNLVEGSLINNQALTLDQAGVCDYFDHVLDRLAGISGFCKVTNRVLNVLVVIHSGVADFDKIGALNRGKKYLVLPLLGGCTRPCLMHKILVAD
jgi:hypothetical protein